MDNVKKAKVIMLPTKDNPTSISIGNKSKIGEYHQFLFGKKEGIYNNHTFQHLYIISDDEIKKGDWFIQTHNTIQTLVKCDKQNVDAIKLFQSKFLKAEKIIATTDDCLKKSCTCIGMRSQVSCDWMCKTHKDYFLPQPSQQFIEKYIESYNRGEIITDVLVEYEHWGNIHHNVEIIEKVLILKVNPKDNTIIIKKLKDNYSKEEIIKLLKSITYTEFQKLPDWIEENL